MPNATYKWNGPTVVDPGGDPPAGVAVVSAAARTSNVVVATVVVPHEIAPGMVVTVDLADASYDGVFTVTAVTNSTVTWSQAAADDPAGGTGTITPPWLQGGFVPNGSAQAPGWRQKLITDGYAF